MVSENRADGCTLVRVPFHGTELEAAQLPSGEIVVSLRRCCEVLDVVLARQLAKLRQRNWSVLSEMYTVAADGRARAQVMISVRALPLWLATINPNKVRADRREVLVAYQEEAAEVLYRHFMRPAAEIPPGFAVVPESDCRELALHRELQRTAELVPLRGYVRERWPRAPERQVRNVVSRVGTLAALGATMPLVKLGASRHAELAFRRQDAEAVNREIERERNGLDAMADAKSLPLPLFDAGGKGRRAAGKPVRGSRPMVN